MDKDVSRLLNHCVSVIAHHLRKDPNLRKEWDDTIAQTILAKVLTRSPLSDALTWDACTSIARETTNKLFGLGS